MKHFENLSIKDIEGETWVDVVGYEGLYLVSNFARVKSVRRVHIMKNLVHRPITERILKQTLDYFGYLKITLWKDAKSLSKKVHRILMIAFIKNKENLPQINHKDGDKKNNQLSNLEWCTASDNIIHAYRELNKAASLNGRYCHKGKDNKRSISIVATNKKTGKKSTFFGINEASRELNINVSGISLALNRTVRKKGNETYTVHSAGGYFFDFK